MEFEFEAVRKQVFTLVVGPGSGGGPFPQQLMAELEHAAGRPRRLVGDGVVALSAALAERARTLGVTAPHRPSFEQFWVFESAQPEVIAQAEKRLQVWMQAQQATGSGTPIRWTVFAPPATPPAGGEGAGPGPLLDDASLLSTLSQQIATIGRASMAEGRAGIGLDAAEAEAGPFGAGTQIVVVERGAHVNAGGGPDHPDLPPGIEVVGVPSNLTRDQVHGIATLGLLVAQGQAVDPDMRGRGVAPNATVSLVSEWDPEEASNGLVIEARIKAILTGALRLNYGDVLLVEAQSVASHKHGNGSPDQLVCAESILGVWEAVWQAAQIGLVVMPASNTVQDMANLKFSNLIDLDTYDTGSLVVGAADPDSRRAVSAFGTRVNCYAWGSELVTLATWPNGHPAEPNRFYGAIDSWGGSSGASAVLAGIAAAVQSARRDRGLEPLPPLDLRTQLADPARGSESLGPLGGSPSVGVMPDLSLHL